ncbi:MAG: diacylglycerol kinase family lipid kinase [Fimbriimonadaceae bacterium]|nr:diacylglycerol kinase family lipid kinase [Fimbriimonadaceae bacterium]
MQEPRRVRVILNPAAGRGQGARRIDAIGMALTEAPKARIAEWKLWETRGPGHARELASQALAEGATVLAAAGGDGTLNEVLNGAWAGPAEFAVLPIGTGNDFARALSFGTDFDAALNALVNGEPRPVDVGFVNDRAFLNIAGCGFDAMVADRINRGYRSLRGTAAYVAAVVECLCRYRAAEFRILCGDEELVFRAMLCSVANTCSYGGGMRIAPDAQIDDGLFDVAVVRETSRFEFLRAFPSVFRGKHTEHPKYLHRHARWVRVESDPPMPVLVDGEVVGTTPATFTIRPRAIRVLT